MINVKNRLKIKKLKKCLLDYKNAVNLHPQLSHGVIGNTPVFGTDIQGSSPCGTTSTIRNSLFNKVDCGFFD